jgi:hypothetical protein
MLEVGNLGLTVSILSGPIQLEPDASGTWNVRVTNVGSTADIYELSAFGVLAPTAQFSPETVSLAPGQSQDVQLTAGPLETSLPQDHILGVLAQSQTDPAIRSQDTTVVSILEKPDVDIAWVPVWQTISGTLTASFSLVVTNTGNVVGDILITGSADPEASIQFETSAVQLPARGRATLLTLVHTPQNGAYQLTANARSGPVEASASAELIVIYTSEPPKLYLPLVIR